MTIDALIPTETPVPRMGRRELLAFLGLSTSLVALGIDVMLPANDEIRLDLGLEVGSTATTALITFYFFGMAIGTLFYGPMADRFGRRSTLHIGLAVYIAGAVATAAAPSLGVMLAARFLWGLGAAGPRTIAMAIVRDRFEGDAMSRAMSTLMAIFMTVPIVAPSIGSLGLTVTSFRGVFLACGVVAAAVGLWSLRLVESLRPQDRLSSLTFGPVRASAQVVFSNRAAIAYTLAVVALFGAFTSFISTAELIYSEVLNERDLFPIYFGLTAAIMGVAAIGGGRIVGAIGMERTMSVARRVYVVAAFAFVGLALVTEGVPPIYLFIPSVGLLAACQAVLIPNFNTAAMAPLGAVAGMASSVIGATQTAGGTALAAVLDRFYDESILPLSIGFLLAAAGMNAAVTVGRRATRAPVT